MMDASDEVIKTECFFGGEHDACKPHTCPYREEIDNDNETLCNCCDDCKQQCADDI